MLLCSTFVNMVWVQKCIIRINSCAFLKLGKISKASPFEDLTASLSLRSNYPVRMSNVLGLKAAVVASNFCIIIIFLMS